jgi:hypothetical protein
VLGLGQLVLIIVDEAAGVPAGMLCETADDVQGIDEGAVGDEDSHAVQIVIVEVTVALETVL